VPIGLAPNTGTASYRSLLIFHNEAAGTGTVIRGQVVIVAVQPDVLTDANGLVARGGLQYHQSVDAGMSDGAVQCHV